MSHVPCSGQTSGVVVLQGWEHVAAAPAVLTRVGAVNKQAKNACFCFSVFNCFALLHCYIRVQWCCKLVQQCNVHNSPTSSEANFQSTSIDCTAATSTPRRVNYRKSWMTFILMDSMICSWMIPTCYTWAKRLCHTLIPQQLQSTTISSQPARHHHTHTHPNQLQRQASIFLAQQGALLHILPSAAPTTCLLKRVMQCWMIRKRM